jgi:thioredoxin-like negative regulator of GroEL
LLFSYCLFFILDKPNSKECDKILEGLERIDDDLDAYGVDIVRTHDPQLAKRYGIKDAPALVYFRNGQPLLFTG